MFLSRDQKRLDILLAEVAEENKSTGIPNPVEYWYTIIEHR